MGFFILRECKHSCTKKPDLKSTTSCHCILEQVFIGLPPQIFTMYKLVLFMVSISHAKLYTAPFNLKEQQTASKLWPHPVIALQAWLGSSSDLCVLPPSSQELPAFPAAVEELQASQRTSQEWEMREKLSFVTSSLHLWSAGSSCSFEYPQTTHLMSSETGTEDKTGKGIQKLQPT